MKLGGLGLVAILALSGCGASPASTASSPPATPQPSSTTSQAPSAGDLAACKAYGRIEEVVNPSLKDLRLPAGMVGDMFTGWADDLTAGTVTATDRDLVESLKGTADGLRATGALVSADPQRGATARWT